MNFMNDPMFKQKLKELSEKTVGTGNIGGEKGPFGDTKITPPPSPTAPPPTTDMLDQQDEVLANGIKDVGSLSKAVNMGPTEAPAALSNKLESKVFTEGGPTSVTQNTGGITVDPTVAKATAADPAKDSRMMADAQGNTREVLKDIDYMAIFKMLAGAGA